MCSWNIGGAKDKLNNNATLEFLHNYDIIWILETKQVQTPTVPGFLVYHNASRHGNHRGGVMLLVKQIFHNYLVNVNLTLESQIWFELSCYPNTRFGGIYIPPEDSLYYDQTINANIYAQLNETEKVVMLGDFNARVGKPEMFDSKGNKLEYVNTCDSTQNAPGKKLLNLCKDKSLVIANHLKCGRKNLGGNLSYRKGKKWISELDLCLVHEKTLPCLKEVTVRQDIKGSDHAPLCVSMDIASSDLIAPFIQERAKNLGKSYFTVHTKDRKLLRTEHSKNIKIDDFRAYMSEHPPPVLAESDLDTVLNTSFELISDGAKNATLEQINVRGNDWEQSQPRWKNLLERNDSSTIWKAINWKGKISEKNTEQPKDEQFKLHFENLLNTDQGSVPDIDLTDSTHIPVLDNPFTLLELNNALKDMKTGKSYTGICPGLLVQLPILWHIFFLTLFNIVFQGFRYPVQWTYSKLVTLFKSGDRMSCGNYRGISIMDTLAKVYDKLILNRLTLWSSIDKCQAGAQKGRGCIEQIMSLRLLIDLAKYKKTKLYVLFIDFSKAYDKVPRNKLIEYLKSIGCGKIMLYALKNMYKTTYNVLNSISISSSSGVRQGAPTSCLLFITYVDKMVKMIKEAVPVDGFLGDLHVLMLMDDTVILATSIEMCIRKLNAVLDFCDNYGMEINVKKTKFMVINNKDEDKLPIYTQNRKIEYCLKYLYLGSWFTDDGDQKSILKLHEPSQTCALNKFMILCHVNTEMPYYYKSLVMDAAVTSSIFYGCEAWLGKKLDFPVNTYNKLLRILLGVRENTSINMSLIESGKEPAKFLIRKRQKLFLINKMKNRDMEEPFQKVYEMCRSKNTPGFRFLQKTIIDHQNEESLEKYVNVVKNSALSKFETYRTKLNPELNTHKIYGKTVYIPDYLRTSFSRLRLMSQGLRIETGRWSRTKRVNRVCQCNGTSVQDECHVVLVCSLSVHLRTEFGMLFFASMNSLIESEDIYNLCKYIHKVLKLYE